MRRRIGSRFPWAVGLTGLLMVLIVGCSKGNSEALESPIASSPLSASATPSAIESDSPTPGSTPEAGQTDEPGASAGATSTPAMKLDASPAPSMTGKPGAGEQSQSPTGSTEPTQSNSSKGHAIESKYEPKFSSIRSSCQAKVSNLTGEVTSYIAGAKADGGEVSIADLQQKFLGKVAEAEGSCDRQFNDTLAQAEKAYKDAGVEAAQIDSWRKQYESGKSQARLTAMSKILAAWNAE